MTLRSLHLNRYSEVTKTALISVFTVRYLQEESVRKWITKHRMTAYNSIDEVMMI